MIELWLGLYVDGGGGVKQSILSQRGWDGDRPMQNTREH